MRKILCLTFLFMFSWACGGTPVTPPVKTPEKKVTWDVTVKPKPQSIRPNIPTAVCFTLKHDSDKTQDVEKIEVTFTSKDNGKKLTFTPPIEKALKFVQNEIVFPAAGSWTAEIKIFMKDNKTTTVTQTVTASCSGDKSEGSTCCAKSDCGDGLMCVYGSCSKVRRAEAKACLGKEDCASGICSNGKCAAAACKDQKKNGWESDVDCGGVCGPCKMDAACNSDSDCKGNAMCAKQVCTMKPGGLLGDGKGNVQYKIAVGQQLSRPIDLDFHPTKKDQLWIVNRGRGEGGSFTVVSDFSSASPSIQRLQDRSKHFLQEVVSISFGPGNTMGTCGDARNDYGGRARPNDFMGPVMWPADLNQIIRYTKRGDVSTAHLDMLHSTPLCTGIAGVNANQYYLFNGLAGTLDWNDFKDPHPDGDNHHGGHDHSDGVKKRFLDVKLKRVPNTPSNLVYDAKTKWLYIADSGNGRVLRVNTEKAVQLAPIQSFRGDGVLYGYTSTKKETIVPAGKELQIPSGLALYKNTIYVADNKTSTLYAYSLEGKLLNKLKTSVSPYSIGGLTISQSGRLFFVDMKNNRVLEVIP